MNLQAAMKIGAGTLDATVPQVAEAARVMQAELARLNGDELHQLARELADSAAISDIECYCLTSGDHKTGWWYELAKPSEEISELTPDDHAAIAMAARYLELRGILVRHAARAGVVTFRKVPR